MHVGEAAVDPNGEQLVAGAGHIPPTDEQPRQQAVQELKAQRWYGKANRLSSDHPVPWEAIDRVAEASRKP